MNDDILHIRQTQLRTLFSAITEICKHDQTQDAILNSYSEKLDLAVDMGILPVNYFEAYHDSLFDNLDKADK